MRKRKNERRGQFVEVLGQIRNILKELCGSLEANLHTTVIDESDLSLRKLEELRAQLVALKNEKSDRIKQVDDHLNTVNSLCMVLGLDFKHTISEIHPALDDSSSTKSINVDTIKKLSNAISYLKEIKIQRMKKLQDLATAMVELWSLMDTPMEEQQMYQNVTRNIAASETEITEPNTLSLDFINFAEAEVSRLQQLKSSKIREVILKKKFDLEEICRKAHMVIEANSATDYSVEAIESGAIDSSYLLEQIELHISNVKEEAFSRKDILEKVEKWLAAREEECWLEEYNRDENRYNAGRGTHLILKRAEKARAMVNKIPAMVETLTSKAKAWRKERGVNFSYDGVCLLSMLEQYNILKQEKEKEHQRQRDQKKLQGQLITEQETLFGSKPSPSKSGKKVSGALSGGGNKRFSLGGAMLQTLYDEKTAISSRPVKKNSFVKRQNLQNHHQNHGSSTLSSGNRNLDPTALAVKHQSSNRPSNLRENDPASKRKPLSPLSSSISSNTIIQQDQKSLATPTKNVSAVDQENRTPKSTQMAMPVTPLTVSVAMQTTMTPATPSVPRGIEEIEEYSFEERRAGFVVVKPLPKPIF